MCKDNCPCRNGTIFVKDKVTKSSPFFGHMPIPPLPDSCQTKITDATKQEQDSCPGFQQVAIAFEHQGKRFQYRFFFLNAILAMSQKSGTLTLSNILWMLIPRSREPQLYGSAAQFLDPDQPRLLRCSGCSWNIYMDTYLCNEMSCNGMKQCIVM